MRPRQFRFLFHYNKPATLKAGAVRISVHYRGRCHIVENVVCWEPVAGRVSEKSPRFVVAGSCFPEDFEVVKGVAYIGMTEARMRLLSRKNP